MPAEVLIEKLIFRRRDARVEELETWPDVVPQVGAGGASPLEADAGDDVSDRRGVRCKKLSSILIWLAAAAATDAT